MGNEEEKERQNENDEDFNPPLELDEYGEPCPFSICIRVYNIEHTYYEDFTIDRSAKVLNL